MLKATPTGLGALVQHPLHTPHSQHTQTKGTLTLDVVGCCWMLLDVVGSCWMLVPRWMLLDVVLIVPLLDVVVCCCML